jgi:hypothetical protein
MQRVGSTAFNRRRSSRNALALNVCGVGVALACVPLACAWFILHDDLAATSVDPIAAARPKALTASIAAARPTAPTAPVATAQRTVPADPIAATQSTALTGPNVDVALLDVTSSIGPTSGTFSRSPPGPLDQRFTAPASVPAATPAVPAPPQAAIPAAPDVSRPAPPPVRDVAQGVPLPRPRPLDRVQTASLDARAQVNKVVADTPPPKPTIFEKLFGKPDAPNVALAYAAPDGGVLGDGQSLTPSLSAPYDRFTAVYDISAATVYLPNGTKLEAHSGLGNRFDDPRFVHEKMRGATPPHVYDLKPREAIFHGVRALRLNPVGGESAIFGRTGLLAHTYMLGPRGDSFGCVSFKNYNAFLKAYEDGDIKRLAVVARVE